MLHILTGLQSNFGLWNNVVRPSDVNSLVSLCVKVLKLLWNPSLPFLIKFCAIIKFDQIISTCSAFPIDWSNNGYKLNCFRQCYPGFTHKYRWVGLSLNFISKMRVISLITVLSRSVIVMRSNVFVSSFCYFDEALSVIYIMSQEPQWARFRRVFIGRLWNIGLDFLKFSLILYKLDRRIRDKIV